METYLIKASAILALFLLTYQLLLRNETFFKLNRYFLLSGIGAALLLPLVSIPEEVAIPVELVRAQAAPNLGPANPGATPAWDVLLWAVYLLGALFFTGMVGKQLWSLLELMRNPDAKREDGVTLVPTDRIQAPFSFFRYVFYNPKVHDEAELQQVLEHEKAHARQLHSLDVLLGRITAILLWMNPLAWWYQKSMQQNLEYLADAQAVRKLPCVREYQYTLLKVSGNTVTPALVNSFNSSLIKKRIVMLQQNQSKTIHLVKYLLILPVLAAFLMAFNREPVYIPQAGPVGELILPGEKTIEVTIDKETTDEELVELKKKLAGDGVDFSYTTVRNDAGEIIDISFNLSGKADNGNPFSGTYNSDSEEPIKPI
ncbi:MAG: M56 family metallopeptidase, partial [Robiginitalea sp.]|nr:M56 family metallopeptidase [Robiginitalea sp.]